MFSSCALLRRASAALGLSLLGFVTAAHGYEFRIDTFSIERNGSLWFQDQFTAGGPPPQAPNFEAGGAASYSMIGTMGPEASGLLTLNSSGAVLRNSLVGGGTTFSQAALLNSNIDSGNTTAGLKRNHTFSVTGIFDLIAPAPNERYSIRLTDENSSQYTDVIDLRVTNIGGLAQIQFRKSDPLNQLQTSFFLPLDSGHDQIALILDHPTADTNTIFGRYRYIDGGVGGSVQSFVSTFDIFGGELFTQARFDAQLGNVAAVPEPSTYALMLAGLGLVGFAANRRREAA